MPRRRDLTRVAVASLVAVLVVGLLMVQINATRRNVERLVGITLSTDRHGIVIAGLVADLPAARGGLQVGDQIVSINGGRTVTEQDYDRMALAFQPGQPVLYEVLRSGQRQLVTVVPGVGFPWFDCLLNVLTCLGHLALGLVVLVQRPFDVRARVLTLFTLAVAFEFALPSSNLIGHELLLWFSSLSFYLVTGIQMGAELHLASIVPVHQPWLCRRPWVVPCLYLVGVAAGTLPALTMAGEQLLGRQWLPWSVTAANIALFRVAMPLWALGVALLLANQAIRHAGPLGRHQAGLVFLAVIPWVIMVLVETSLFWVGVDQPPWFGPLSTVAIMVYPVAVFLALFRYQLFNIELVLRRSLVYSSLTALLVAVLWLALAAGGALFSLLFGSEQASMLVVSGATLLIGLLFSPLRAAVQRAITRRFFPERDALRQRLISLARELPAHGNLPLMGKHLVAQLAEIFSVETVTVLILEPESRLLVTLASHGISPRISQDWTFLISAEDPAVELLRRTERPMPAAVLARVSTSLAQRIRAFGATIGAPLLSQDELIGLLLLGGRRKGSFVIEEVELLSLLSHHVATVFENTRLFASATFEGLTGLYRREAILEILNRELQRAQRYGRPLSVGMADLDHFKRVNDSYGHLAGDRMLQLVAETLQQGLRSSDAIGRYGGEEFLFVLPETGLPSALKVAAKLRELVEQISMRVDDERSVAVTASIGIASVEELAEQPSVGARDLIALADKRLLAAKSLGRNRVEPARAG